MQSVGQSVSPFSLCFPREEPGHLCRNRRTMRRNIYEIATISEEFPPFPRVLSSVPSVFQAFWFCFCFCF